jgi:circadian clock protein KaiC
LLEGVRTGEPTLYITLSETERELRLVAKRHGWSLNGITIFELIPPEISLDPSQELTVLHPADMELSETTQMIFDRVEALAAARIVLDSLSELRLLAQSPLRYRRQILALKHFFSGRKSTVVLLDDLSSQQNDLQLHSIAHGVVLLEQLAIDYGAQRRRLRVVKMRGIDFKGGFHDFTIRHGGLKVYPRLVAAEHHKDFDTNVVLSGNSELDALLGGGLKRGTNAWSAQFGSMCGAGMPCQCNGMTDMDELGTQALLESATNISYLCPLPDIQSKAAPGVMEPSPQIEIIREHHLKAEGEMAWTD